MVNSYTIPLVFAKDGKTQVDEDLSLALIFWSLEYEREKGGGFLRKKKAENITQVSFLHHPILITKYGNATVAFDACGIQSTRFKYGIAPSLTHLPSFLRSNIWTSRPESYAGGLGRHSEEFERAHKENPHEVRAWITDPELLKGLNELLNVSIASDARSDTLPQLIDFTEASNSLAELDKRKHLLNSEIAPLKDIKQELDKKTSEVLAPLKRECSLIEDRYNKEIDRIRPSVLERKEKFENKRMNQRQQIEARFSGRLHDLRNRRDAAAAKIDAHDPHTGREPRGGIDKQYSIKENADRRIRELEREQEERIATVDEKYDVLIEEQQGRIDSLEDQKEANLEEPRGKMKFVNDATDRLTNAIEGLIEDHNSIIGMGSTSSIIRPAEIDIKKFIVYLPTIISRFEDGAKSRTIILTARALKYGKGFFGSLKGLVGLKATPLEEANESLTTFITSVAENPKVSKAISFTARQYDVLRDPKTKNLAISGMGKMQAQGWIKEKEIIEFRKAFDEHFVPSDSADFSPREEKWSINPNDQTQQEPPQSVRFVSYKGVETQVEIGKLEILRKEDQEEFNKDVSSTNYTTSNSARLIEFLRGLKLPDSKSYCINHGEVWVQHQLYTLLANSEFRGARRERSFRVGETGAIGARIDFDVGGVGIEVKIFRSPQDFQRLTNEMLTYRGNYGEIIIPYINAGGLSNEELEERFKLLSQHYPEVKGYFPLNCGEDARNTY